MTTVPKMAAISLALIAISFPAIGDEAAPPRSAWKKADLQTREEAVRWVVEGCAAYPVMAETAADETIARSAPAPNAEGPEVHLANEINALDKTETQ